VRRLLAFTLGFLTAIGGFLDIGDLVANSLVGARFKRHVRWERVAAVEEGVVRVAVDAATLDRWWHGREPD
jgi:hypothetical protein